MIKSLLPRLPSLALLLLLSPLFGACKSSRPSGQPEPASRVSPGASAEKPSMASPPAALATPAPAAAPVAPPAVPPVVAATPNAPAVAPPARPADENVVLTTPLGRIVIDLFEEDCPAHAESFKRLVRTGYLNGTTFHRVCPGFAQGGDPTGSGKGGTDQTIPAEIKHPNVRGAVVAARRGDERNPHRESHGSQFFILKTAAPQFDGQYTVFGRVVEGMEVVDRLPQGDREKDYQIPSNEGEKILRAELVAAVVSPLRVPQRPGQSR
jgi:cyclophilin family peptidyl-prolyl cis-trans isomerase